jgi:heptosyltransferase-1
MSLPFLMALKNRFPEAKIDWVAETTAGMLLSGHPLIDKLIVFPKDELKKSLKGLKLRIFFKILKDYKLNLREHDYDLCFDLQGLFKSGLQVHWSNSLHKIGFAKGREYSSIFLNHKLPPYDPNQKAILRYLLLAQAVGASLNLDLENKAVFFPDSDNLKVANELLKDTKAPRVSLALGTRWVSKLWPAKHFAKLIELLAQEGISSVITGASGEKDIELEVLKHLPSNIPVTRLLGKTSPKELAALYSLTDLTISADSGPLHLAAAVYAKTLALFGPTRPERVAPIANNSIVLKAPNMDCLGCLKHQCPLKRNPSCMEALLPELVLSYVLKALNKA